jgi:hypothetical protein
VSYDYIRSYYGVPAETGRRVRFSDKGCLKEGVIVGTNGLYIKIHFDGEKKPSGFYHPEWKMEYLEMGEVPKVSRSKARYQRFLSLDSSMTFREFLAYEGRERDASKCGFSSVFDYERWLQQCSQSFAAA